GDFLESAGSRALGLEFAEGLLKGGKRFLVEENEVNFLERRGTFEMLRRLAQHDFGALAKRESGDARSHRGERDRLQPVLSGDAKRMRRRAPQRLRRSLTAKLHARRVDHVAGLQAAARCDRGAAHRDRADLVAFRLNAGPALAADRPGDATAELKVVVGGVDDRVRIHLGEIALLYFDSLAEVLPSAGRLAFGARPPGSCATTPLRASRDRFHRIPRPRALRPRPPAGESSSAPWP